LKAFVVDEIVAGMTSVSLSTASLSVTSSVQSCLPVQVPIGTGSSVSSVAVGATAAVGILVGALVALAVSWLIFRQCLGKVGCMLYILCYLLSSSGSNNNNNNNNNNRFITMLT